MRSAEVALPVWEFIDHYIDNVPQLEALLLMRQELSRRWFVADIAGALHLPVPYAILMLEALESRQLLVGNAEHGFRYSHAWDTADIMNAVVSAYREHLIPIATYIHGRTS